MVKISKGRTTRPTARKPRPGIKKGSTRKLRGRRSPVDEEWEAFADNVVSELRKSLNPIPGSIPIPYDEPKSVVKRMVYKFVREQRGRRQDSHIEQAIENFRDEQEEKRPPSARRIFRTMRVDYKQNPFYRALVGVQSGISIGDFELSKPDVSRFSQQLLYADRHNVPPALLIGFLHQSGTLKQVLAKVKDPNKYEDWFSANHAVREIGR